MTTSVDDQRGLDIGVLAAVPGLLATDDQGPPGVPAGRVGSLSRDPFPSRLQVGVEDLVATPADEGNAAVSPDGRWIAFETNDTGRWGIAVRPASGDGATVTIAADGRSPVWIDGHSLLYLAGDHLMRVNARPAAAFDAQPPVHVARGIVRLARDVSGDGRVLVTTGAASAPPSVTLEWFDDLRARLEASQPLPRSFR